MLHICFICNEYPPVNHGGIGSCNHDLAEGLVAAGHEVTVIGVYSPEQLGDIPAEATINGVRIIRLPALQKKLSYPLRSTRERLLLWRRLRAENRRKPFDLIENSDYEGWLPFGGPRNVPVIARLHGTNALYDRLLGRKSHWFEHWLERRSQLKADFWIGVSQFAFDESLCECSIAQHDGVVVHNGVDTNFFKPDPEVAREQGSILFVNSINPRKGPDKLIEAAQLLFPRFPDAKLTLVGNVNIGGGRETEYLRELTERIKPEYRGSVVFTGRRLARPEVLAYLQRAQVCCFPSHAEMFALAPLEAMAAGAATVYSKIGPGYEAIEDGVSGLLCDASNPADIAAKIEMILANSEFGRRLGEAGRLRVQEKFNKADWVARNIEVFMSFMEHWRARRN